MEAHASSPLTWPPRRSRAIRNSLEARPVQGTAQLPRQSETIPIISLDSSPSTSPYARKVSVINSGTPIHTLLTLSKVNQIEDFSATRLESSPCRTSTSSYHIASIATPRDLDPETGSDVGVFGHVRSAGSRGILSPRRSLSPNSRDIPASVAPTILQGSKYNPSAKEKAELNRKSQRLVPPSCDHADLIVSRGHEELNPPLKKIYKDDIDIFLYMFARWAFEVDTDDEAGKRMYDILSKFQNHMDFVSREPSTVPISHTAQNGLDLGRMVARRAFQTKLEWTIPAIIHLFCTIRAQAEQALIAMGEDDYVAYTEWGPGSWMDAQLREKFFFEHASSSLEEYYSEKLKKRNNVAAGKMVDKEPDVYCLDGNDGREGRLLTEEEIHEASEFMEFLFLRTGGCGSFEL